MTGEEFATIAAAIRATTADIAQASGFTDRHVRRMQAMDVVPERAAAALVAMEQEFVSCTRAGEFQALEAPETARASRWIHRNFVV